MKAFTVSICLLLFSISLFAQKGKSKVTPVANSFTVAFTKQQYLGGTGSIPFPMYSIIEYNAQDSTLTIYEEDNAEIQKVTLIRWLDNQTLKMITNAEESFIFEFDPQRKQVDFCYWTIGFLTTLMIR